MSASKLVFSRFGGWYTLLGLVSLLARWWIAGPDTVLKSLGDDAKLLAALLPLYAAALLIGGFAQVLLPKDGVARWLGPGSGLRGLCIGTLAGVLAPAGPFVAFPIVLALFKAGADIGALVAFLTAWSLLGIYRLAIWDVPMMGLDLAALRYLVSLPLPILAGLLARRLDAARPARPARDGDAS